MTNTLCTILIQSFILQILTNIRQIQCALVTPWSLEAQNEMLESTPSACWKCEHIFEDVEGWDHLQVIQNLILSVPIVHKHEHTSFTITVCQNSKASAVIAIIGMCVCLAVCVHQIHLSHAVKTTQARTTKCSLADNQMSLVLGSSSRNLKGFIPGKGIWNRSQNSRFAWVAIYLCNGSRRPLAIQH